MGASSLYPKYRDPSPSRSIGATGDDLRAMRVAAGLSLRDIGDEIGVTRTAINNLEVRGPVVDWLFVRHQRAIAAILAKRAAE